MDVKLLIKTTEVTEGLEPEDAEREREGAEHERGI